MTNHVAKIIEVVGTSEVSIDDAIKGAVEKAAQTLDNLQWFEVIETRGNIARQKIERFQVVLKIAFGLTD
jgi:dodecin